MYLLIFKTKYVNLNSNSPPSIVVSISKLNNPDCSLSLSIYIYIYIYIARGGKRTCESMPFRSCGRASTTVWMHYMDSDKMHREMATWGLHKNATRYFK